MEITTVGLDIAKRVFQQPPELGLVGFGNAVDVGGDLITWCAGSVPLIAGDLDTVGQVGHPLSSYGLVTLSALSLASLAGGIAGIASSLPLGFKDRFPLHPLSEFPIAGLLLGF